jgi:hypothetical protein
VYLRLYNRSLIELELKRPSMGSRALGIAMAIVRDGLSSKKMNRVHITGADGTGSMKCSPSQKINYAHHPHHNDMWYKIEDGAEHVNEVYNDSSDDDSFNVIEEGDNESEDDDVENQLNERSEQRILSKPSPEISQERRKVPLSAFAPEPNTSSSKKEVVVTTQSNSSPELNQEIKGQQFDDIYKFESNSFNLNPEV